MKKGFFNSPVWPTLLSAVIAPGMGQIANRDYVKGAFLLISSLIATERFMSMLPGSPKNHVELKSAMLKMANDAPDMFLTFELLVLIMWLFGVVDAFLTARARRRLRPVVHEEKDSAD